MPAVPHVRVGVAAFVLRAPNDSLLSSFILMGKRLGSHGSGTWALPGGHIEHGETFEECITREIMEETGLSVKNVRFLTATNDIMPVEAKHYVTIFMVCEREAANGAQEREPEVKEPEKCEGWKWSEVANHLGIQIAGRCICDVVWKTLCDLLHLNGGWRRVKGQIAVRLDVGLVAEVQRWIPVSPTGALHILEGGDCVDSLETTGAIGPDEGLKVVPLVLRASEVLGLRIIEAIETVESFRGDDLRSAAVVIWTVSADLSREESKCSSDDGEL
ncbi:uncharacterized protein KY384_007580 [Bacidia gigantensis]|uniref:uncharacterized protein n=1 Tax=Bacidia gigantensis TaxID=2732470 RepID=UPI001D058261|nr:uncharacterized protein KY384_007580 [Bacidia gigantensis]KAG8527428.1 hypothetical protein KY384_007580 [Bacidia gigantensis]